MWITIKALPGVIATGRGCRACDKGAVLRRTRLQCKPPPLGLYALLNLLAQLLRSRIHLFSKKKKKRVR